MRKDTKDTGNEYGLSFFRGESGIIWATDVTTGSSGSVKSIKDAYLRKREFGSTLGFDDGELKYLGIYHTHPNNGEDANPMSLGDMQRFIEYIIPVKSNFLNTQLGYSYSNGSFLIADDTGGKMARYAAVINDINLASSKDVLMNLHFDFSAFIHVDFYKPKFN